ncbi:MAG: serine acetyltransferase [Lachnospiraceae bacterium]|jgi:serine O-acetyltransferase|nr:serine acetyltransferase [Lachnospiraceae bacterium]
METNRRQEYDDAVQSLLTDYRSGREIDRLDFYAQPDREEVTDIVRKLLQVCYPGYYRDRVYRSINEEHRITVLIEDVIYHLRKQIAIALRYNATYASTSEEEIGDAAEKITLEFIRRIPGIRAYLETDLQAAYDGDPAATGKEDIVLSYPGLMAISINRLAHELFQLKVPLIPRIMTEYAHSITGIDIHPGATIGKYFMIDHGTGVVVGETSVIGDHVKVYQGVTIGALSTRGGQNLRGIKRHPTIEDDVTIYAGASILGGMTVIGKGSVIGSNAFITSSIAAGTRVSIRNQELQLKKGDSFCVSHSDLKQEENWFYVI